MSSKLSFVEVNPQFFSSEILFYSDASAEL